MQRSAAALLLVCGLLGGGGLLQPAAAQPGGAPSFVSDAQALPDLAETGFLTDEAADILVSGAPPAAPSDGQFGLVASGPSGELVRLKQKGTAISAFEADPIPSAGAISLACGFAYLSEAFRGSYIGVGQLHFSKGLGCGRCARVQCDDRACLNPGASVVVQVVDLCGDCEGSDISLSLPAFTNFTGTSSTANTIQMSWEFVDCAPYINGTIKMLVKPGGNAYYQSFGFPNFLTPIVAVQVNGDRLRPSTSSSYWEWNPGKAIDPRGPFEIALAGSSREVLRVRISQLRSQDIKVQFKPAPAALAAAPVVEAQGGAPAAPRGA